MRYNGSDEEEFKKIIKSLVEKISEVSYEIGEIKSYTRTGVACFVGAKYEDADRIEHEVKRKIMEKRKLPATSRAPIYDTTKEEHYLAVFDRDEMPVAFDGGDY